MISEKGIAKFSYEEAPRIVTDRIPGPKAQEILKESLRYQARTRPAIMSPLVLDEALGATIKDVDGNIFVDAGGGVAVSSVGRNNPKVVEAIRSQSTKLMHCGHGTSPRAVELAKKMANIMPGGLRNNCFTCFTQSGSAAIDTAIKYARAITGKSKIIAFEGAYHGVLCGSLALTTNPAYRTGFGPLIPGVIHMPYAYCYRCFANLEYPSCGLACAEYFDNKVNTSGTGADDVAAVFIEPVQGEGGYVDPPPEFLRMIKAACDKKGILFVVDEIQSGAGRTGKMWAIEHAGVVPEMLVFGKGIGGDAPMAGVTVREDLHDKLPVASHANTFSDNAVSCVVASTNIDILTDENTDLIGRAAKVGQEMKDRLIEAAKDLSIIGEVRGKGFMIGVELVKNKKTREPISSVPDILKKALERGIVLLPCGRTYASLRICPSLVISKAQFTKVIDVMLDVLEEEAKLVK